MSRIACCIFIAYFFLLNAYFEHICAYSMHMICIFASYQHFIARKHAHQPGSCDRRASPARTDGTRSTTLRARLRYLQSTRTPTHLQSPAVSARPPIRLLPPIPGNGKAHRCWATATRWRRRSSGAKGTDSGRLRIIIMTRLKSGSANI